MSPPRPISRNAPSSCARSPGAGRLIRFRSYLNVGRGISKGDVSPPWIIFLPTFWIMPKSRGRRGLSGEEERESFNPQSSTAPQAKRKRFSRTESPPGSRVKSAARPPVVLLACRARKLELARQQAGTTLRGRRPQRTSLNRENHSKSPEWGSRRDWRCFASHGPSGRKNPGKPPCGCPACEILSAGV